MRRFKITPTEIMSEEMMRAWVLPYCSASEGSYIYISYDGTGSIIVELDGICTAPGTQEVV